MGQSKWLIATPPQKKKKTRIMEGTPLAIMSPLKSMLRQKRNYENSNIRQGQKKKN